MVVRTVKWKIYVIVIVFRVPPADFVRTGHIIICIRIIGHLEEVAIMSRLKAFWPLHAHALSRSPYDYIITSLDPHAMRTLSMEKLSG